MKTTRTRVASAIVAALAIVASVFAFPGVAQAANNNKVAFDYFVNKGLTKEQSAGIVGNLIQEAGDPINPRSVQPGGPGRGIAQWSVGERWASSGTNSKPPRTTHSDSSRRRAPSRMLRPRSTTSLSAAATATWTPASLTPSASLMRTPAATHPLQHRSLSLARPRA